MTVTFNRFVVLAIALVLSACAATQEQQAADDRLKRAAKANAQLGVAYMREGDLETAEGKLQKAIEQDPDSVRAHDAIAVLYGRIEKNELAEKHFKKALSLKPDDSRTQNNYGLFLCQTGAYLKAEEYFNKAASNPLYSGRTAALTNAGVCANKIPDAEKAEQYFRTVLEIDPYYTPALLNMVSTTYEQGNYMSARGYLQRYEQVAPYSAESLWLGVRVEDALKDRNASGRYGLLLKNNFSDTTQAKSLQEWENERRNR
jgi:type IV pilus assembly protein PilF